MLSEGKPKGTGDKFLSDQSGVFRQPDLEQGFDPQGERELSDRTLRDFLKVSDFLEGILPNYVRGKWGSRRIMRGEVEWEIVGVIAPDTKNVNLIADPAEWRIVLKPVSLAQGPRDVKVQTVPLAKYGGDELVDMFKQIFSTIPKREHYTRTPKYWEYQRKNGQNGEA